MGLFIDGKWQIQEVNPKSEDGDFVRLDSVFRDSVTVDSDHFAPESGRYELMVSLACPWAHRTLIMRQLKGLDAHVGVIVVDPLMGDNGWSFTEPVYGCSLLGDLYLRANSRYTGRVTVPVLWDTKESMIVNNESSEIIRMLNDGFSSLSDTDDDYYPENLRSDIDTINDFVYERVNNGVYRVGFAQNQTVYEQQCRVLFDALDALDERLKGRDFLVGDQLTEADIRLYVTLVRFDFCYVTHFKCNMRRLCEYANLYVYLKRLYQIPAFRTTTDLDHCKRHYFTSHLNLNPSGIVPIGPDESSYFIE